MEWRFSEGNSLGPNLCYKVTSEGTQEKTGIELFLWKEQYKVQIRMWCHLVRKIIKIKYRFQRAACSVSLIVKTNFKLFHFEYIISLIMGKNWKKKVVSDYS